MGEVLPDWTRILSTGAEIDLVAAVNGGYVVDVSDRFYGDARNMLMPYPAPNMGDGWETKRRRGPGHDWAILRLGIEGMIRRLEIDTAHYKGNYPDTASFEATVLRDESHGVSADVSTRAIAGWKTVLQPAKLEADHLHVFDRDLAADVPGSHVRLNIFPDGGISRLRVFGTPLPDARRHAVLRQLNAMDIPGLRGVLAEFNGAPGWIDRMVAARPFTSAESIAAASDEAARGVSDADWLEAFRHHPPIGERQAERVQSETARGLSASEQDAVQRAAAADLAALAEVNRAYQARFGYVFIVAAGGRTAPEILAVAKERMKNDPATELRAAVSEQQKITRQRLARLLG